MNLNFLAVHTILRTTLHFTVARGLTDVFSPVLFSHGSRGSACGKIFWDHF